jgi:hypothetical protein
MGERLFFKNFLTAAVKREIRRDAASDRGVCFALGMSARKFFGKRKKRVDSVEGKA